MTYQAELKALRLKLRYAQMWTRMDIQSLARSKDQVRRIAKQMRDLQKERKGK
jgi:hypothetical protein